MRSFLKKLFPQQVIVDQEKIDDQIRLSFGSCQFDKSLFLAIVESGDITPDYNFFSSSLLRLSLQQKIDLRTEVSNLNSYLQLYNNSKLDSFFYKFEVNGLDTIIDCPEVPPLILFPLIKNALYSGYNTMAKFPVRIRVQLIGNTLKLEVSNRSNHYVENQELNPDLRWFKTRLEQEYADRYTLLYNSNTSVFKATLILMLK